MIYSCPALSLRTLILQCEKVAVEIKTWLNKIRNSFNLIDAFSRVFTYYIRTYCCKCNEHQVVCGKYGEIRTILLPVTCENQLESLIFYSYSFWVNTVHQFMGQLRQAEWKINKNVSFLDVSSHLSEIFYP